MKDGGHCHILCRHLKTVAHDGIVVAAIGEGGGGDGIAFVRVQRDFRACGVVIDAVAGDRWGWRGRDAFVQGEAENLYRPVVLNDVAAVGADVGGGAAYDAAVIVVVGEGVVAAASVSHDGAFIIVCADGGAEGEVVADGAVRESAYDAAIVITTALAVVGHGGGADAAVDGRVIHMADDAAVVFGIIVIGTDGDGALHAAVGDGAAIQEADNAADVIHACDGAAAQRDVLYGASVADVAEEALVIATGVDMDAAHSVAVAVEGAYEVFGTVADGGVVVLRAVVGDVRAQLEELVVVVGAAVHLGGQQVEARRGGDDVGAFLGGAVVVGVGMPVADEGAVHGGIGGGHGEGVAREDVAVKAIGRHAALKQVVVAQGDGGVAGVVGGALVGNGRASGGDVPVLYGERMHAACAVRVA